MASANPILLHLDQFTLGTHTLEYKLDDQFFAELEQDEVLGGTCTVAATLLADETTFKLKFQVEGEVQVTCDRCLDPMTIVVDPFEESFLLKLAHEDGEDDEAIYVNQEHPDFDLGWLIYETIAVRLPVVHSHLEGECNAEMASLLQAHLCTDLHDEE